MPKLIVMVKKDDTGKLWNYLLSSGEGSDKASSLPIALLLIHKTCFLEETTQPHRKETIRENNITIGAIPIHDDIKLHVKSKEKAAELKTSFTK